MVQYTLRFWAALSLDAEAVTVVRIGPEEVDDGPNDNNTGQDSEDDNEGDSSIRDSAVAVGVFQDTALEMGDGRHTGLGWLDSLAEGSICMSC